MIQSPEDYRKKVLKIILDDLQPLTNILAAWEGGSAAMGTKDQYSDIDLCLLTNSPQMHVLDRIQNSLEVMGISHTWQTQKSFWGEGLMQRVILFKDSPKFFLVDVGVFDEKYPQILKEFLEIERHGRQIVYFDKVNALQQTHTNSDEMFKKHQLRVKELSDGFVVFKLLVEKEIARGKVIDAMAFYQNGLVRPLVEVLGMIHRPFKSDFGMRYVHKDFPADTVELVKNLVYVSSPSELNSKITIVEKAFIKAVEQVRAKTKLI